MEQKNKQLMIFLAGELQSKKGLLNKIKETSFDFYAADGGYLLAEQFHVELKKIIGDFDSSPKPDADNVILFPSEKDETDSELALKLAKTDGYSDVWMVAPFGGRFDHTIANVCLLETAFKEGISLKLYDGSNLVFILREGVHAFGSKAQYISFFPWGDSAEVSLKGFKYPVDHYTLLREKPIGVSNEPRGSVSTIEIHRGAVLCVCVENHQEDL